MHCPILFAYACNGMYDASRTVCTVQSCPHMPAATCISLQAIICIAQCRLHMPAMQLCVNALLGNSARSSAAVSHLEFCVWESSSHDNKGQYQVQVQERWGWPKTVGMGKSGCRAGRGCARLCRAGQCRAGQCRARQCRAGLDMAAQGRKRQESKSRRQSGLQGLQIKPVQAGQIIDKQDAVIQAGLKSMNRCICRTVTLWVHTLVQRDCMSLNAGVCRPSKTNGCTASSSSRSLSDHCHM